MNSDNVLLSDKLDEVVKSLDQELNCVMDILALTKKCTLTLRAKKPWYDEELCALKRKLRKHERKWFKYKLQSNWSAFSALRNKYTHCLRQKKMESILNKILACKMDTCQLYKLINNLTTENLKHSGLSMILKKP